MCVFIVVFKMSQFSNFEDVVNDMGGFLERIKPASVNKMLIRALVVPESFSGAGSVYSCFLDKKSNYRGRIALVRDIGDGKGEVFGVGIVRTVKREGEGYRWVFFKFKKIKALVCYLDGNKDLFDVLVSDDCLKNL